MYSSFCFKVSSSAVASSHHLGIGSPGILGHKKV